MTRAAPSGDGRLVPGVRALLLAFAALTLLATNQLFVLATRTAEGFAWTIQPPLTAAFLGAGYAAGCVLVVLSLRSESWAVARTGFLTVLVFTVLFLVATILHRDRFHFDAAGLVPRAAAWLWLVVYTVVPVAMIAVLPRQLRVAATRRTRAATLGPALRVALLAQAVALLAVGAALYVPVLGLGFWPWSLTPLTARSVASWLLALGVGALLALREDDLEHLRPAAVTYTVLGVLQLVALARFPEDVDWGRPSAWVYVAVVLLVLATGAAGLRRRPEGVRPGAHRAGRTAPR